MGENWENITISCIDKTVDITLYNDSEGITAHFTLAQAALIAAKLLKYAAKEDIS